MGNRNSKDEAPQTPVAQPVNVLITKEVTKRWEMLHLNQIGKENENANEWESVEDVKKMDEISRETESCSGESNLLANVSHPSMEEKYDDQQPIIEETAETFVEKNEEGVLNGGKMDKFANFFIPKNTLVLDHDLEIGDDDQDQLLNSETRYSAFFRKPTEGEECTSTTYEEINETLEVKKNHEDFFDEEAGLGRTNILQSKQNHLNKVYVSKPLLPVVLDEDEEGKVTIETVNAWKIRQRLEQKISENDAHWNKELQQITAKIEDETQRQAEDIQKRIEKLKIQHGEIIEPPFTRVGGQCNPIVSHIANCYQKNENQVLKCSELVRQFAHCANKTV